MKETSFIRHSFQKRQIEVEIGNMRVPTQFFVVNTKMTVTKTNSAILWMYSKSLFFMSCYSDCTAPFLSCQFESLCTQK